MKATKLRIGNYYQYAGDSGIVYTQVQAIKYNQFGLLSDFDGTNFEICKPIPLTEEWLLRLGFKEYKYEDEVFGYVLNDFGYINEYQFRIRNFIDFEGIIIPKAIKTVHQLQNLYFALTGEELSL